MLRYCLLFLVSFLIISCNHPEPKQKNIIGTWMSNDGAKLVVEKDGSISLMNFPLKLVNNNMTDLYTGKGNWEVRKSKSVSPFWIFDILTDNNANNERISLELLISRSGLGGSSSEITTLFIWKGDPDLDDRYEFKKQ